MPPDWRYNCGDCKLGVRTRGLDAHTCAKNAWRCREICVRLGASVIVCVLQHHLSRQFAGLCRPRDHHDDDADDDDDDANWAATMWRRQFGSPHCFGEMHWHRTQKKTQKRCQLICMHAIFHVKNHRFSNYKRIIKLFALDARTPLPQLDAAREGAVRRQHRRHTKKKTYLCTYTLSGSPALRSVFCFCFVLSARRCV